MYKFYVPLLMIVASMVLVACTTPAPDQIVETVVATHKVAIETEATIEEATIEHAIVEDKIASATPKPEKPVTFSKEDPTTFTWVTIGDVDTFDPAWNYESAGGSVLLNTYDMLVTYPGPDANKFAPGLATRWEIVDEGKTYVFHIREGVKFHEGQDLDVGDVAYSFQRGLLQGGTWSPQWLLTEAFFGAGIYDVAELVNADCADDPECLQAEDPEALMAVCERVTHAIAADEAAGTVTFYLSQPWAPLLATLTGSWGAIIDRDWAAENGAWDGDCATWQNYYGITSENAPLREVINGTGPYKLDHWTPGEEVVLLANEDYWRDEPAWEGGPIGAPAIKRVVISYVDEWGIRFAMMRVGDADLVSVPRQNVAQLDPLVGERCDYVDTGEWTCEELDPTAPLKLFAGYPQNSRADVFFVFDINAEGGNPYIGSGKLDGKGIPADFFSDVHVRKAFNYCFDWDAYIEDAGAGEAVQNFGPINQGLIGYDYNAPHYSHDPDLCAAGLKRAWDGAVWENGFRMQIGYGAGAVTAQTVAQILQANLRDIDPRFNIETIALPSPSFWDEIYAERLPLFVGPWSEDIHDPHNWAQPFLVGGYAARQNLPDWMYAEFGALVSAGVAGTTDEQRAEAYREIQRLDYEYAPGIRLAVPTGRTYLQRWVTRWDPMLRHQFYYYENQ